MAKTRKGRQKGYSAPARIYSCQNCNETQVTYPPFGEEWQQADFDNSAQGDFGWSPITPQRRRWLCADCGKVGGNASD